MVKKKRTRKTDYTIKIDKNDPLNWWNKFWLGITLLIIIVEFICFFKYLSQIFSPKYIMIPSFGIPFILMVFQYRQLRKIRVFIAWFVLSLILFAIFLFTEIGLILSLTDDYSYACRGLKTPILFLISFYFFSIISKSLWRTELILPSRGNPFDTEEGRKTNFIDYIAFFSYWLIILFAYLY